MGFVTGLSCRNCASVYPADAQSFCEACFGPLEVDYDYEAIRRSVTKESIASGPPNLWRYAGLLPVDDPTPISLGAGYTPLSRAQRLGAELGLRDLWIKDDTRNPTGSFKDRVVSVALTKAREARPQGRGVRVDRQPCELVGCPRRLRGYGVGRLHPDPPRSREGDHYRRLRRQGDRRRREL